MRLADQALLEKVLAHIGRPHAKQAVFLDKARKAASRKLLYGGARGGGKSNALRRLIYERRLGIPGSVGLLLRRTYPELRANHILQIMRELPVESYRYNGQEHEFRFPNGSRQVLGYCRNDADVLRYQGTEWDDIEIDELTQWQEYWYDCLCASCRSVRRDVTPIVAASANPGGIGHGWVKRRWIDRDFDANDDPNDYDFVPATVDDNPTLLENDPDYVRTLDSIKDENLRRAWRFGDWDVFEGQYFAALRRETHGFTGAPPEGWTFRMLDYGLTAPSAVYWGRVDYDGDVWLYKELYERGLIYSALATRIVEMTAGEPIRYTVAPPDVFARSKGTGEVGTETLAKGGVPCVRADDNRIEGWRHMQEWIHGVRLHVSTEACRVWWRTVPGLVHDQHNPEDVDTDGEDHAGDATRYGLMSRPYPAQRPEERIDPMSAKAILDEMRGGRRRRRR